MERGRDLGDVGVLAKWQFPLRTILDDTDIEEPLESPQLSHIVAGKQGSTEGPELSLSWMIEQHDDVILVKEEDHVVIHE